MMAAEVMVISRRVWWTTILILALPYRSLGAQEQSDACASLPAASVPEGDRPTLADVRAAGVTFSGDLDHPRSIRPTAQDQTYCDGEALYYGNDPQRFSKARACVLAKLGLFRTGTPHAMAAAAQSAAANGATEPSLIDREGLVLAMVYANGEGVRRDLSLARQFLCQYGSGIGSDTGSEQLAKFNALVISGKRFDMCSDEMSFGRGVAYDCLGMEMGRRADELHRRENAILSASSPELRNAFLQLRDAWRAFHSAYGNMDGAICDGGTGCGPATEGDDLEFTASWLAALKDIQAGTPPAIHANPADLVKWDRDLNEHYRRNLEEFKDCTSSSDCIAPTIRKADRAWLVYREAWVRFGSLRWPALPADQWRAWQTLDWNTTLSP